MTDTPDLGFLKITSKDNEYTVEGFVKFVVFSCQGKHVDIYIMSGITDHQTCLEFVVVSIEELDGKIVSIDFATTARWNSTSLSISLDNVETIKRISSICPSNLPSFEILMKDGKSAKIGFDVKDN